MSNDNPFNGRSLQDGENFLVEDWSATNLEPQAGSSFPSVNASWGDASLGETSGYEWNQSSFQNGFTSVPISNYHMSDAGSSNGSEIHYQTYDPGFDSSSPASGPYPSLIPDCMSQRRNSLPSDYLTHRSMYGIVTRSGDEGPDTRRHSWQGAHDQNEQLYDAASSSYHSSRRPSFENLAQLATDSMPMPYPTGARVPAYGHYHSYSDPDVIQSAPTNVQRWQPSNSPASSAGELPYLNRTATPGISAELQSTLFLHDSDDLQRNIDPSFHPDIISGFGVYPSGTQVPEEHAHSNNSQPIADGTGSHPGSSDTGQVSTGSRFIVFVPNDSAEAGPSNSPLPYHMLPEMASGFPSPISGELSRNSSKSKHRGEPRAKSVACNYCRTKKNKCVGDSGEPCESCTTLNLVCTYSESRRGKYERKSKKKGK
ncbi:hypothetical protein ARMGADRAFT_1035275 [Armillaria gallica]|uniref:Zn(2)-C6 fungal-type domain-containing protein n=1 Tax=Armillaria gallica TaxID=47427 RepID=A0A2H3CYZ2_ARMGA|nr:hypothetical protein ARMGADRAFT_1035275 [Armillaria gallica]